ncbi:hypothetical protein I3760_10G021800 [Carya illinoinensis]|nr:hypothetical protein I3760_10G021800 [Carya illinoinensis]
MRTNIVTEAGLPTRLGQWWDGIPFLTSAVVVVCGIIYLVCLLVGYDSFFEICFLPSAVLSRFQVYRIYTSIFFHGSLLHVLFNMLALIPLGSELERIMGSVRFLYTIILLATSNAIFHLLIALVVAHNPFHRVLLFMNECSIGLSGIIFSMIVIETRLSGIQSRSVFGLFNVPAIWYALILLIVLQLLMTNVSLLGHLCGILSGFAYTYGLFNFLMPGTSFYSTIESSSWLSTEDSQRFMGRGRTLGSGQSQIVSADNSDSNLQARLLDNSNQNHPSDVAAIGTGQQLSDGRQQAADNAAAGVPARHQGSVASDEEIQKLVSMGFEKTQVEVALAAADGDLNVAVEILMNQQG